MLHLADCSSVARAQFSQHYQVLGLEIQLKFDANFERVLLVVVGDAAGDLRVAGGWRRFRWRSAESKTLEVLPLHRLWLKWVAHGDCGMRRALFNDVCG